MATGCWQRKYGCACLCALLQVFLNTKSGPQVGAQLRRRFLRLLNPLQVSRTNPMTSPF